MALGTGGAASALAHISPRPTKTLYGDNYLSFDSASGGGTFAQQFLPEIYEKEIERFGKRTVSGFLKMVGAEMPLASDQVIWSEQGRLHVAYDDAASGESVNIADASANTITLPAVAAAGAGFNLKVILTATGAAGKVVSSANNITGYVEESAANGGNHTLSADTDANTITIKAFNKGVLLAIFICISIAN